MKWSIPITLGGGAVLLYYVATSQAVSDWFCGLIALSLGW